MVEAEDIAVAIVKGGNQGLEIGHVVGELVEYDFRLGFCKRTHLGYGLGTATGGLLSE